MRIKVLFYIIAIRSIENEVKSGWIEITVCR